MEVSVIRNARDTKGRKRARRRGGRRKGVLVMVIMSIVHLKRGCVYSGKFPLKVDKGV